jgi:hypothetical protein
MDGALEIFDGNLRKLRGDFLIGSVGEMVAG